MDAPGEPASRRTRQVVGRELELRRLHAFLEGASTASCLVLSGEAGIGKTTLWEAGLEIARQSGYHVISARSSVAEAALTFVVLADLVDGIDKSDLSSLPAPQRRALQVTLHQADPMGAPPDPLAVSAGFLNALMAVNKRVPLLVAIDDVQWLDEASAVPLMYAARRLKGAARFLLARRPGGRSELERVLLASGVEHVDIAGMSVGAMGRMLSDQVGVDLSWRALRRVHEGSQGNALFALELGRLLGDRGGLDAGDELPLPELAEDVFRARIKEAAEPVRQVLLAAALSGSMSEAELATLLDPIAIEDAVTSGVVVREGARIRATHPMLAAVSRKLASPSERHELHLKLASAASDPTRSALHLALATVRPDAGRAAVASDGAALAAGRGRVLEAVQLAGHALRITPPAHGDRGERVLALARLQTRAGRLQQMIALLLSEMGDLPPGRYRALALLLLHDAGDLGPGNERVEMALAEAGDEADVRALAYTSRALDLAVRWVERIDESAKWAEQAVSAAESTDVEVRERVRTVLAWTRVLQGRSIDDLAGDGMPAPRTTAPDRSLARELGVRLAFRGQHVAAKTLFGDLLAAADERDDLGFMAPIQLQLCEVELRAGHVTEAARMIDNLEGLLSWEGTKERPLSYASRIRALLAAVTGDPVDAVRWGRLVLQHRSRRPSDPSSPGWDRLEAERALGIAAIFDRDDRRAVEHLQAVWDHTRREHVADPGAFPVAGDLVEALVATERIDEARQVIEHLSRLSVDQDHPWGLATVRRGEALLRLATAGYEEDAAAELAGAAAGYGSLGLDFDRARTLLSLGLVERRYKKWAAARALLEEAAALFDEGGSAGWAHRARDELKRVSGRRSAPADKLTPTETRVVHLAASGMSNKAIARELFVSVNTVEGHLSRAYAKLGVRSRGQLVHVLREMAET